MAIESNLAVKRNALLTPCFLAVAELLVELRLNMLRSSADLQLYDSEFQTEGALTLKAFADNASGIRCTESNNLSDDRNVLASR